MAPLTQEAAAKNTIRAFLSVSESIPEDPESISNILQHIATCNAQAVIGTPGGTTQWPDLFYPTTTVPSVFSATKSLLLPPIQRAQMENAIC